MRRTRLIGLGLIIVGIAVPYAIDAYETANHLDIPRDIGVLPWLVMALVGIYLVVRSFIRRKK